MYSILSPCLFNLYAECIMRNAGLDEAQAGIKIAGRNFNNLIYADDTILMAESEELKSLLLRDQRPNSGSDKMAGLPRRIIKETQHLLAEPVPGIKAEPDESNARYFHVVIASPQDSHFEGGVFKLELFLPEEYPMAALKYVS